MGAKVKEGVAHTHGRPPLNAAGVSQQMEAQQKPEGLKSLQAGVQPLQIGEV
jgi:hypothetical protein